MICTNTPETPRKLTRLALALSLVLLVSPLWGQNVIYTMTSGEAGSLSPTSSSLSQMTAGDMAFANIGDTGFSTSQNSNGRYAEASGDNNFFSSTPKPGADDPYYSYTLTPESGVSIKLNSVSFGVRSLTEPTVPAPAPGPRSYDIYTSVDGFATPVASGNLNTEQGDNNYWYYYANSGLDITGTVDAVLEIRIVFREATEGVTRAGCFRIDDVKISASAVTDGTDQFWAGYPVQDGLVDTGDWMGWLYVVNSPWVYSYPLMNWVYINEPAPEDTGGWFYVTR